jgi:hypothetical protein
VRGTKKKLPARSEVISRQHISVKAIGRAWQIRSPDLDRTVGPLDSNRSGMWMPPVLPHVKIDYSEVPGTVEGTA